MTRMLRILKYKVIEQNFKIYNKEGSILIKLKDRRTNRVIEKPINELVCDNSIIKFLIPEDALGLGYLLCEMSFNNEKNRKRKN